MSEASSTSHAARPVRVVIAAGGTGGHVMPALAVADALRARGADVSFITTSRAGGIPEKYPSDRLPLRGFARKPTPKNLWVLVLALFAVPRAMWILRRRHADVVVGGGGYLAGPVAVAARLLRRRVLLMEADSHLGLANRLAAPLAKRVTLAFPLKGRRGGRYMVTGRPVSQAVIGATRTAGRRSFGIAPDATVVLVAGGSQGARTLNLAAAEAFGDGPPFDLIHVAGPTQVNDVRALLADQSPGPRYRLEPYLENFAEALAAADLVVSRSGGTVFEIAAVGRPAIFVPYPHATGDHQTKNAAWMAQGGAAVVLTDAECTGPRLRELVGALLADRDRLQMMADSAAALGRPEAADRVAEAALDLVDR
jgi:UDP-N-acetylglucosamine--N-acetylmuramyl-(pentapeptide) pyrophosphoryl-undecaprenol N-acetylglucosamine transferase